MRPQKAQVKNKGLGAECWDFGLKAQEISKFSLSSWATTLKTSLEADWQAIHKVFKTFGGINDPPLRGA
ncbi:MAG: hypothetical protein HQ457_01790 [Betaproteobacteria bacterium]|nr:hypothetical protein [Betaproteobacteria bacterium]